MMHCWYMYLSREHEQSRQLRRLMIALLYYRLRYVTLRFLCLISIGHQPGADLGPVISPASKERICNLVQSGIEEGAKV